MSINIYLNPKIYKYIKNKEIIEKKKTQKL